MKTLLVTLALLLTLAIPASAQSTLYVQWDANPAADNVRSYTLTIDGTAYQVAPVLDQTCGCINVAFAFALGSHTVSVTASNPLITSDPVTVTFLLKRPARITNIRIR